MLHNHLRNFTSHELLVHFYAADQSHDGPYGIDQLGQRIEIGRHHRSGLHDAGSAVALRQTQTGVRHEKIQRGEPLENRTFLHRAKI